MVSLGSLSAIGLVYLVAKERRKGNDEKYDCGSVSRVAQGMEARTDRNDPSCCKAIWCQSRVISLDAYFFIQLAAGFIQVTILSLISPDSSLPAEEDSHRHGRRT